MAVGTLARSQRSHKLRSDSVIQFPTARHAEIVAQTIAVDAELQPALTARTVRAVDSAVHLYVQNICYNVDYAQ